MIKKLKIYIVRKVSKYGVISEITTYLDTFHAVLSKTRRDKIVNREDCIGLNTLRFSSNTVCWEESESTLNAVKNKRKYHTKKITFLQYC